jgi:hypothetical protein
MDPTLDKEEEEEKISTAKGSYPLTEYRRQVWLFLLFHKFLSQFYF